VATLRRYSIVKTRRPAALFTPERAILGLFCVAAGASVFMTVDNLQNSNGPIAQLARGHGIIKVPIAEQIARKLNEAGQGINGKKAVVSRVDPAKIAALLEEKRRQAAANRALAAERRRKAGELFTRRNNVDRTPVASIGTANSPGFTVVRPKPNAPGFQELPRWRPQ